jgi:hypothetical protein
MTNFREVAWQLAQEGQLDLAMTAWTRYALEQERQGKALDPAITENLQQASKLLAGTKDGFTANQDESLLDYLITLQKEIKNYNNLQPAIETLLNEWRTSPNRNLYDWTLQTIRTTKGPEDRVLVLAAIGGFLEKSVDRLAREMEKIGLLKAGKDDIGNYAYQKAINGEIEEAIFWWTIAAGQGDSNARANLEICEQQGLISKNTKQLLPDIDERIATKRESISIQKQKADLREKWMDKKTNAGFDSEHWTPARCGPF